MAVLKVWLSAMFVSIGSFLFGFDTGSIGSITEMPQFHADIGLLAPIIRGVLVSCMLMTSALAGFVAGGISDRISRKYTMAIGGAIFCLGSVICAASPKLASLIVGRCIAGIGEGFFLSIVAVYCVEISPARSRGRVTSIIQMSIVIGICLGFFTCYGSVYIPSSLSWRLPFILQSIVSLIYCVGCALYVPMSPRYLHMKGRTEEAEVVMRSLNRPGAEMEKEEWEVVQTSGARKDLHWRELFEKGVRKRTLLACFLQGSQQLSGIDGLLFYAPTLFAQAGITGTTGSFLASGVSGLVQVITTAACLPFMDRIGRRTSTIYGGLAMGTLMLLIASLYASGAYQGAGKWPIIISLYLFVFVFACTWAMTMRLYASEIQPLRTRAAVSSIATACNQAINTLVALTIPLFLEKTMSGPYWLFMACLFVTVGVAWTSMPETRRLSLEEIDKAFLTTKSHRAKSKVLHHNPDIELASIGTAS